MDAVVRVSQLQASDYLVGDEIGVERKVVHDLHRSIASRRLWSQLYSYRSLLRRLYLLVEGESLDGGLITPESIRGALLEIGERGVTVIRTTDPGDSAAWILQIAVRAQRRGVSPKPRPRRYSRDARPASIIMSIPGVGPRKARHLLNRFGSVAGIASADPTELRCVPGVGPALSKTIHDASTRT
jgi:DNA excision repair protein ERCC-4